MAKRTDNESLKLVKFYVSEEQHTEIRLAAAIRDLTIDEFCGDVVRQWAAKVIADFKSGASKLPNRKAT